MMLFDSLTAAFGAVIQYFFGSSSGCGGKDQNTESGRGTERPRLMQDLRMFFIKTHCDDVAIGWADCGGWRNDALS
jgi:hypothetical protein